MPEFVGAVIAVDVEGIVSACDLVAEETPEAWAKARQWIRPLDRTIMAIAPTTPAR